MTDAEARELQRQIDEAESRAAAAEWELKGLVKSSPTSYEDRMEMGFAADDWIDTLCEEYVRVGRLAQQYDDADADNSTETEVSDNAAKGGE